MTTLRRLHVFPSPGSGSDSQEGQVTAVTADLMAGHKDDPTITVTSPAEADIILCHDASDVEKYHEHCCCRIVVVLTTGVVELEDFASYGLPENVVTMNVIDLVNEIPRIKVLVREKMTSADRAGVPVIAESTPKSSGAQRILVIDDRPHNVRSAEALLSGHFLTTAQNYEEGRLLLESQAFEVVLTDLRMPKSKSSLELQSFGYSLMFVAAGKGVKRIVVYTDLDHHGDVVAKEMVAHFPIGHPFRLENSIVKILASQEQDGAKDWAHALAEALK